MFLLLSSIFPIGIMGQEINKSKRTFIIKKNKPTKVRTPNIITPLEDLIIPPILQAAPSKEETTISKDSLEIEYQKWLRKEPIKMTTPQMGYRHYIEPDLKQYNPDRQKTLPKVGYHYDPKNVKPENQMVAPRAGLITFDFARIISKEARNRARDIEHHKRARKILEHY